MARPSILALPLLLAAAPAAALTPEELWSAWQAQAQGFGVTLGAEAVSGGDGSLTLRNWTRQIEGGPVDPLPSDAPVQQVILRPVEDGAVEVDFGLPEQIDLPGGAGGMGDLRVEHDGLRIVARDATDGIDYEVTASSVRAVSLVPDWNPQADDFAGEAVDLRLTFPGQLGPDRTAEVALSVGGVAYVTNLSDPFTGGVNSTASRTEGDLSVEVAATLPEGLAIEEMDDTADLLRALDAGLAVRVGVANGAGTQLASVQGFPFSYRYESTVEPGEGMATFDRSGLLVTGSLGGGTVVVTSPDLPVPSIDATYGPISADLRLPFGPEPGDFRYGFSFEDVSLADAAWDMLDPQGVFPREPLSFRLDLGGRLAIDLAATAQAETTGAAAPPPIMESIELRALEASGAGLRLSAEGRVEFDSQMASPLPGGSGLVRLEGINQFLEAVIAMGWAAPGDLLPVRAGLAGFFRETSPDVRETTLEVREGGAVFANGLQIN